MALVLPGLLIDVKTVTAMAIATVLRTLHLSPAILRALVAVEILCEVANIPGIISGEEMARSSFPAAAHYQRELATEFVPEL